MGKKVGCHVFGHNFTDMVTVVVILNYFEC